MQTISIQYYVISNLLNKISWSRMFKKILLIVTNMIYKIVHSYVRKKYIVYNLQTIFFE